ncbi:hypothetical protein CWD84_15620 [Bacillus siamensis]|uniref:Uncharacterized protein n=1 Tax=Bacillus siamensis TaxID=659243 RepID=A0AAI8HQ59_9BACI|nr:hypothetical protein CWD84_15620 [Bacillus siamensis]
MKSRKKSSGRRGGNSVKQDYRQAFEQALAVFREKHGPEKGGMLLMCHVHEFLQNTVGGRK